MNSDLNYQVIELGINNRPVLQTIGLNNLMGIELCMQLVIDKPLARGLITQIARHYLTLAEQPSLFNDPWIDYVFKENTTLCLLPFVLLKEEDICHIIVPDLNGLYPWQLGCQPPFHEQVDEQLVINNLLVAIKAHYLSHLMLDVATNVYKQIGFSIDCMQNMPLEEIPDYLAEYNLDMYIILTLCFNETMDQINQTIVSACQSISVNLEALSHPLEKAKEMASQIYDPLLSEKYVRMIMRTFHRLTE